MYWLQTVLRLAVCVSVCVGGRAALADPGDQEFTTAATHYAQQEWQQAVSSFDAFRATFPEHQRAHDATFFAGEALLQLGQYAAARERFLTFIEVSPQHPHVKQASFRAAESLFLAGDEEAAARELLEFGSNYHRDKFNAYALAYRAEIALNADRAHEAEAIYRECIELFPDGPLRFEVQLGLARTLEALGTDEQALEIYRRLASEGSASVAADAALRAGLLLHRLRQFDAAVQQLAMFETDFVNSRHKHEARYWTGLATLEAGNVEDASKIFQSAISTASNSPVLPGLWFGLAKAQHAAENKQASLAYLQRIVNEWPQSEWADDALYMLLLDAFEEGDAERFDSYAHRCSPTSDVFFGLREDGVESIPADSDHTPQIAQLLGREALRRREYNKARQLFERVDNEYTKMPDFAQFFGSQSLAEFRAQNSYYLAVAYLALNRHVDAWTVAKERMPNEDTPLRHRFQVVQALAMFVMGSYEAGRYRDAAELFKKCVGSKHAGPEVGDCRAKLAICYAELGNVRALRETLADFRREHASSSLFHPTIAYLAEFAASHDQPELARELYALLTVDGTPEEYVAKGLAGLGAMQLQRGDVAGSEKTFDRLLAKAGETHEAPQAALLRARSIERAGKLDAAVAAYRSVAEDYSHAEEAPVAMLAAAKLQDELGQDREAAEFLLGLLKNWPDFDQRDAATYQLAWVYDDLAEPAAAGAAFEQLVREFPKSTFRPDAMYRVAERAYQANDLVKAKQWLQQLLREDPDPDLLGHAWYLQGRVAAEQSQWDAVISPMSQIAEQLPEHELWLPAQYWIAESRFRQADYEQAAVDFAGLEEATFGSDAEWVPMVILRVAQVAAHQRRWPDALDAGRKLAKQFPGFRLQYEADYIIGRSLSARGRFAAARDAYNRVVRSPAGSQTETAAMAQWMIGESFFHQKEYRYALRAYERVTSLHSFARWHAASLLQAGKCHEALDEPQEAVKSYVQLIQQYPKSEFASAASMRLRVARREATSTPTR